MKALRVILMGTPDFPLPSFQALAACPGIEIVAVYTQPPRPAGRRQQLRSCPVQLWAEQAGLPVFTPVSLKKRDVRQQMRDLHPDLAVVAAYGLLLPQRILDIPTFGCLNIHASLLPRWRGAAPIQRAIISGDRQTGINIMQMDAGLDTGAVVVDDGVAVTSITPDMTASQLHDRLSVMASEAIVRVVSWIRDHRIQPDSLPQSSDGITYAEKITSADTLIDWNQSAALIMRHIHGLASLPGAYFMFNGKRCKILQARYMPWNGDNISPGTVIDADKFLIACGQDILQPVILQLEGKRALGVAEFLRGQTVTVGTIL